MNCTAELSGKMKLLLLLRMQFSDRGGLADPNRPTASFILVLPGAGKTEWQSPCCLPIRHRRSAGADWYVGIHGETLCFSPDLRRLDMWVTTKVVNLLKAIRRRPYAVILTKSKKAHPDVFNIMLQILDDGRVTDAQGHTVDFKNSIIIMTINIGSAHILDLAGDDHYEEMRSCIMEAMKCSFRPEFLNRIRDYHLPCLVKTRAAYIVQLQVKRLNSDWQTENIAKLSCSFDFWQK